VTGDGHQRIGRSGVSKFGHRLLVPAAES